MWRLAAALFCAPSVTRAASFAKSGTELPEGASLHDIAREIEFVDAVRKGLAELDRGERIPIEDVEREMPSWIIE